MDGGTTMRHALRALAVAVMAAGVSATALAQGVDATPGVVDVKALTKELGTAQGERRTQLLEQLKELPLSALPAVEAVIADESTNGFARADLQAALPAIRDKARLARKAEEAKADVRLTMAGAMAEYDRVGKKIA
jgi:hypothetical protein